MPSYYDLAATTYDASRYLIPEVAERAATFLAWMTGSRPDARFLELGVGTGANVLPLVRRGFAVTGVDPSEPMLAQFRHKLGGPAPHLTLLTGDAAALPFPSESYDLALTVHVLQNVPAWRQVLAEARRVLAPGGVYANGEYPLPPHRREFEAHYQAVAQHHRASRSGNKDLNTGSAAPPRGDFDIVETYLRESGAQVEVHEVARWSVTEVVGELLGWYEARAFGSCYGVPDEVYPEVMGALRARCLEEYGSLERELRSEAVYRMVTARRWTA
jgi:ubiquinone/menaquinone biosynthesis C-methylase UbiE